MTISLDRMEERHNLIRGNKEAYKNTIKTLDLLSNYHNIEEKISTTIIKENISDIYRIKEFVKNEYPQFNHMCDIIIPTDNQTQRKSTFFVDEFNKYLKDSSLLGFNKIESEGYPKNKFRCSGGVISAFISSDKKLQICAAANADPFIIGNLENKSLYDLWLEPEGNGNILRNSKSNELEKCNNCENSNECDIINCRVAAYAYTKNYEEPYPVICYFIKGDKK